MVRCDVCRVLMLAVIACLRPAFGGEAAPPAAGVDPKADELLRQMGRCLSEARAFSFQAECTFDDVRDSGQKIQYSSTRTITVRRPDRAFADTAGDTENQQAWYNGKTLTVLDRTRNVYGVVEVPATIDEMLDHVAEKFGIMMPLADLLFSDPYRTVIGNVRIGQSVGQHHVHDAKCHHLAFRQDTIDWQIWIQDGEKPLPRKLVITFKEYPGQPQFVAILGRWDLSPRLTDDLFTFRAPANAEKIDILPIAGTPKPGAPKGADKR
jgi:hypothetical protein